VFGWFVEKSWLVSDQQAAFVFVQHRQEMTRTARSWGAHTFSVTDHGWTDLWLVRQLV